MRDGSGQRHYRYLVEDIDRHGNVRVYFRCKGQPKTRLHEKPGTDAFDREYQLAYSGPLPTTGAKRAPAVSGTMQWLCQQYFGSAYFQGLDSKTRAARRRILDSICERVGSFRFALMQSQHVAKLRDEKASTPAAANERVKALRSLFKWAISPEYGLADKDPCERVSLLPSNNPNGLKAWTEQDLVKFETRHPIGTKPRLALDLLLYTGVRISDVVRLGPQMERDGKLVFSETKGRTRIVKEHRIPILPELRASIDATPSGHLVYLVSRYGKEYSVKGFGDWFKGRCRLAEIDPELSAHGLRKLGAQRCVERGATEHQLMALYGWTSTKQAGLYTRKARRETLEAEAANFLGTQTEPGVPLLTTRKSRGAKRAKNL